MGEMVRTIGALVLATSLASSLVLTARSQPRGQSDSLPTVTQAVAPEYPMNACLALFEGRVRVEVVVFAKGERGQSETRVEGPPLLQAAALDAALAWTFETPAKRQQVDLTFVFKIVQQANSDGFESPTTAIFHPPYEVEVRCRPAKFRK